VPYDQDRQLGGAIVGPVAGQVFLADGAAIHDLQKPGEHVTLAAVWTATAKTVPHSIFRIALCGGVLRIGVGHGCSFAVSVALYRRKLEGAWPPLCPMVAAPFRKII
jgi:hypothetical protein